MANFRVNHTEEVEQLTAREPAAEQTTPGVPIPATETSSPPRHNGLRVHLKATLTEGRQNFSDFLDLVRDGNIVLFEERGKPRAMMTPVPKSICMKFAKRYKKKILYRSDK